MTARAKYFIFFLIAVAVFFVGVNLANRRTGSTTHLKSFAKCLKEKGAVFYGASWCLHCRKTKDLFKDSAGYLPYVECSTPDNKGQTKECQEKGITGYPTWKFADGSEKSGELSLKDLAEKTGCVLAE